IFLRQSKKFDGYEMEPLWEISLRNLVVYSRKTTSRIQHSDLRRYLLAVVGGIGLLICWSVIGAGAVPVLPPPGIFKPAETIVAFIGLGGAIAASRAKTLLTSTVATGLTG